jgi:hypothetical protein
MGGWLGPLQGERRRERRRRERRQTGSRAQTESNCSFTLPQVRVFNENHIVLIFLIYFYFFEKAHIVRPRASGLHFKSLLCPLCDGISHHTRRSPQRTCVPLRISTCIYICTHKNTHTHAPEDCCSSRENLSMLRSHSTELTSKHGAINFDDFGHYFFKSIIYPPIHISPFSTRLHDSTQREDFFLTPSSCDLIPET